MSLSAEQSTAFLTRCEFTPRASPSRLIAMVFAVLLVWGVPGYSTVFPMYQQAQYALPGKRVENY